MRIAEEASYFTFFLLILLFAAIDISLHVKIDFSSFYSSISSFLNNTSPYTVRPLDFLHSTKTASINLNTPFFVVLLSPLRFLSYEKAYLLWQFGAFASLAVSINHILHRYHLHQAKYLLAFFFSYPVFMNFFIGQIAPYILLCITFGERALRRKQPIFAGILWGWITGVKLFTGLLFFYLLYKRNRIGMVSFSITFLITLLIPLLIAGPNIYLEYLAALKSINWYIHAWNGSLHGFLVRSQSLMFFSITQSIQHFLSMSILISVLFSYFYLLIFQDKKIQDKAFSLTLIYMLIINPLSWHYYFLLLLEPLASLLSKEQSFSNEKKLIGIVLFILFAYPRHSNEIKNASDLLTRLTTGSQYFYCLLLTLAMTYWQDNKSEKRIQQKGYYPFLKVIIIFIMYFLTFDFTASNIAKLINNSGG